MISVKCFETINDLFIQEPSLPHLNGLFAKYFELDNRFRCQPTSLNLLQARNQTEFLWLISTVSSFQIYGKISS